MEDIFVYDVGKKPEDIEGLAEIRAAKKELFYAGIKYHKAKTLFERGEIDFEAVPIPDRSEVEALIAKYPRAAAYLEAERWSGSSEPIKVRLGSRACERILDGEDCNTVLEDISKGLDAFYMAQEG